MLVAFPCGSAGKESACSVGDRGWIPGLGRSPGEGKGYPLQGSGLENSMDCIVHGVPRSWTQRSNFHFHFIFTFKWLVPLCQKWHNASGFFSSLSLPYFCHQYKSINFSCKKRRKIIYGKRCCCLSGDSIFEHSKWAPENRATKNM